ncbi:MAG: M48 family metallopeptidase [Verrucomicrobiota bacterium]
MPDAFRATVSPETYRQSVAYTLARSRFGQVEEAWGTLVLLGVLGSGILPALLGWFDARGTGPVWRAAWLFTVGVLLTLPGLPLEWWAQFRLEQRFGFNTTTPRTWITDRLKGLVLGALLGGPLLALILQLVHWTGPAWWVWAWAVFVGFQLVLMIVAPMWILPLFNQLTPLPEGPLRQRLLRLGERTGFTAANLLVMDGSKRSRHSNAFFTGFGRFRKIVLFDTLVSQLGEEELEAVLAHEIGHYRRGHVPKLLLLATIEFFLGFAAIGWLARQGWFLPSFGFPAQAGVAPVLLLAALLGGTITFWVQPLMNRLSRRHEYQADAYAAEAVGGAAPLVGALRKLSEKNLSNLTPHPAYSGFHYSHPTLLEREAALSRLPA